MRLTWIFEIGYSAGALYILLHTAQARIEKTSEGYRSLVGMISV